MAAAGEGTSLGTGVPPCWRRPLCGKHSPQVRTPLHFFYQLWGGGLMAAAIRCYNRRIASKPAMLRPSDPEVYYEIRGQFHFTSQWKNCCEHPVIALQVFIMTETDRHVTIRAELKEENWWEYCPICGSKLENHKCRFVCSNPRCRFFMSCSEFDM